MLCRSVEALSGMRSEKLRTNTYGSAVGRRSGWEPHGSVEGGTVWGEAERLCLGFSDAYTLTRFHASTGHLPWFVARLRRMVRGDCGLDAVTATFFVLVPYCGRLQSCGGTKRKSCDSIDFFVRFLFGFFGRPGR